MKNFKACITKGKETFTVEVLEDGTVRSDQSPRGERRAETFLELLREIGSKRRPAPSSDRQSRMPRRKRPVVAGRRGSLG
jgi:hypothetical protein